MPTSLVHHVNAEAAFDTLRLVQKLVLESSDKGGQLLQKMGGDNAESAISELLLEEESDINLQKYLAPFLRQAAINHLRTGKTEFAEAFRQTYEETFTEGGISAPLSHFFKYQGRPNAWSTEVEAGALGNLLNITVVITPINSRGVKQTSFTVNESTDKYAPILQLYNQGNRHWYLEPSKPESTIGDGNCLYNAFAQALRQSALFQELVNDVKNKKTPRVTPGAKANFKKQEKLKEQVSNIDPIDMPDLIDKITRTKVLPKPTVQKAIPNRSPLTEEKSEEDFPDYVEFIPSRPYDPSSVNFRDELQTLSQKAGELKNKSKEQPHYKQAALKAHKLVVSLNKAAISYFNADKMTPKEFINYATKKIKEVRPELEKHRGWSQILGNLALAVVGVGVGYLVAGIINKALTGRFLFFRTESAEKLDDMQRAVKNHNRFKAR